MKIAELKKWVAVLDVPAAEKKRIERKYSFGYVANFECLDGS